MIQAESLLYGGALVGVLVAAWSRIKSLAWRILSRFVLRAHFEGELGKAIVYWCLTKYRKSPFGERRYAAARLYVRPLERYQAVGYEGVGLDTTVFWSGWTPILIKADAYKPGGESTVNSAVWTDLNGLPITLTALRGMLDLDQLALDALELYNRYKRESDDGQRRYQIKRVAGVGKYRKGRGSYGSDGGGAEEGRAAPVDTTDQPDRRYLQWQRSQLGMPSPDDPWQSLAFPPAVAEAVLEAKRWLASQNWYKEIGVNWRRGWLLYGPPGSGKSSLVRAIAQQLDLPVVVFDLASFSNDEFVSLWRELMTSTPCVALLEDIDAVFHGRDNTLGEEGGGLTFDCLLNCLGGVESADGVLTVVTTNRPETLDPALTRPGRLDRHLELGYMDEDCRRLVAQRILSRWPEEIEPQVHLGGLIGHQNDDGSIKRYPDTPAEFTDRCCRIALRRYWEDQTLVVESERCSVTSGAGCDSQLGC